MVPYLGNAAPDLAFDITLMPLGMAYGKKHLAFVLFVVAKSGYPF